MIESKIISGVNIGFCRLPFTMLVLQKSVKMVWNLPEVMRLAYAFMLVVLLWMALWSFGAAGVVASSMGDGGRWWLLVVSWQVLLFILAILVGSNYGIRLCKLSLSNYIDISVCGCRYSLLAYSGQVQYFVILYMS